MPVKPAAQDRAMTAGQSKPAQATRMWALALYALRCMLERGGHRMAVS